MVDSERRLGKSKGGTIMSGAARKRDEIEGKGCELITKVSVLRAALNEHAYKQYLQF